jgi:hypothetical protein
MTTKMPERAPAAARPAPICVACVGDRTDPAGGPCLRCKGTGADPDPLAPVWPGNPMTALLALGARVSPDLDAYASGELDASQVRCVLCGVAPCRCRHCQEPYLNRYSASVFGHSTTGPCGMTIDPQTGECPRGHRQPGGAS